MAFLDNSGDIILDAVLTDTGRKRMAAGNFSIVKFALGDDEIDYGLYNKTHPSGSAYYDLEILQTPILEAFTQTNAAINYGLVTYTRNDLLYLPTIKQNEKTAVHDAVVGKYAAVGNIIYMASGKSNSDGTTTENLLVAEGLTKQNILQGSTGLSKTRYMFIETGLDTTELTSDRINQNSYLIGTGLIDSHFTISYDSRLLSSIHGPQEGSNFTSSDTEGKLVGTIGGAYVGAAGSQISNYRTVNINGIVSGFYGGAGFTGTESTYSVITGPRGAFTLLAFSINDSLALSDFSKLGKTGDATFGSSNTYDYIDTVIYIQGQSTGITMHIPVRIIQAAQSS